MMHQLFNPLNVVTDEPPDALSDCKFIGHLNYINEIVYATRSS